MDEYISGRVLDVVTPEECEDEVASLSKRIKYHASHTAPPGIFAWYLRNKSKTGSITSTPRWIFARCCGQVGRFIDGVVETTRSCDHSLEAAASTHKGTMVLGNPTKTSAFKNGGDVVVWDCCRRAAIPAWEAAWDAPLKARIPAGLWLLPCAVAPAGGRAVGSEFGGPIFSAACRFGVVSPKLPAGGTRTFAADFEEVPRTPEDKLKWAMKRDEEFANVLLKAVGGEVIAIGPSFTAPGLSIKIIGALQKFDLGHLVLDKSVKEAFYLKRAGGWGCAERAALLGDKLLAAIVAEHLLKAHPRTPAGSLTERMKDFTSNEALAHTMRVGFNIDDGYSEHELGTLFECLLSVAFNHGGLDKAKEVVAWMFKFMNAEYASGRAERTAMMASPLALLDQLAARAGILVPPKEILEAIGERGAPLFRAYYSGSHEKDDLWSLTSAPLPSKAEARHDLAKRTLERLGLGERLKTLLDVE